jgi:hypothetical protein
VADTIVLLSVIPRGPLAVTSGLDTPVAVVIVRAKLVGLDRKLK